MNLRRDLPASVVVFLVAVPLSLGIALASGAPVIAGLIGAVAGGIVTGLLAGSPLQVSGPAAGLTVVVYGLVQQLAEACDGGLVGLDAEIEFELLRGDHADLRLRLSIGLGSPRHSFRA